MVVVVRPDTSAPMCTYFCSCARTIKALTVATYEYILLVTVATYVYGSVCFSWLELITADQPVAATFTVS